MRSILEELYCGNIQPADTGYITEEYRLRQRRCVELGEALAAPMNEEQRALFLCYEEQVNARSSMDNSRAFAQGFSLAVQLLTAALAAE